MPAERPLPVRADGVEVARADRITARDRLARTAYRLRGRALCLVGRHYWAHLRNPEVGGARAHYDLCRRCGRERSGYPRLEDMFGR